MSNASNSEEEPLNLSTTSVLRYLECGNVVRLAIGSCGTRGTAGEIVERVSGSMIVLSLIEQLQTVQIVPNETIDEQGYHLGLKTM